MRRAGNPRRLLQGQRAQPNGPTIASRIRALGAAYHFDVDYGCVDTGTASAWTDRIAGYSLSSTSQATRLTWATSVAGLNGRAGWTGVAANSTKLYSADGTIANRIDQRQAQTIMCVRKHTTASYGNVWAFGSATGMFICCRAAAASGASNVEWYDGTTIESLERGAQGTSLVVDTAKFTGTHVVLYSNGVSLGSQAFAGSPNCSSFMIGGRDIGGPSFQQFFDGVIGDIVIFPSSVSDAARSTAETLLRYKFGF